MFQLNLVSVRIRRLSVLAATLAVCMTTMGANKATSKPAKKGANKGPITTLSVNPDAPVVDVFAAMESGQVDVRMSVSNPNEGRIYFTNKTDRPLTVAIPNAIVGMHVLPQQGGLFNNNMLGNNGGMNGMMMNGGNGGGGGMGQMVGGNAMPGGGQNAFPNGGNQMQGNNFFSIPPEKTVQINLHSVCLNYGRPEPHVGMTYRMVKVESVTTDPVLQQLLEDTPGTNQDAQQAAAWHLANGLSWEQIANLTNEPSPGIHVSMFNSAQLQSARQLVDQAKTKAAERPKTPAAPVVTAAVR